MGPLIILLTLLGTGTSLKVGLLFMHGLGGSFNDRYSRHFGQFMENNINTDDVEVHLIDAGFNGINSTLPLNTQVPQILKQVKKIAARYDKVIAVGHSQGGVIWRSMIERWDDHNVDTFIPLASPQHGIATIPSEMLDEAIDHLIDKIFSNLPIEYNNFIVKGWVKGIVKDKLEQTRKVLTLDDLIDLETECTTGPLKTIMTYAIDGLLLIAPLNYYLDSTNYDLYIKHINFFPELNNEKGTPAEKARRKKNFLRLRRMVMIGGPKDGVVVPWQSELFGYFDENGYAGQNILNMTDTRFYTEDLFGLKTLDQRGGVTLYTVENVDHVEFLVNDGVLREYVLPVVEDVIKHAEN